MPASSADAVAVVIVSHWSGELLGESVARVLAADAVAELLVVDNDTRDGSIEALLARYGGDPRLRVIRNAANPGFATACNQGAAQSIAPWLAFLNPDCLIEPDTFVRLRSVAKAEPHAGVVGADVRDARGAHEPAARRREPTLARALGHAFGRSGDDALHIAPPVHARAVTTVDAVSGALMFVPRAAFDRLGGFDRGYRLHCEDLDLCRRMRDAGLRVLVAEVARVEHRKGSSSSRRPLFVAFHKHRGMARYLRKFHGGAAVGYAIAVRMAIWLRFCALLPLLLVRELRARMQ